MITEYCKSKVTLVKAILPFLIVLHHCALYTPIAGIGIFKKVGIIVVSFFFLISGYGLMTCYINKGNAYLKSFFHRRMTKLILPFVLCLLCWIAYNEIFYWDTFSIIDYFKNTNFGGWLPNTWFVWVIFAAYLTFYFIFRTRMSLSNKLLVFCCISAIYFIICRGGGEFRNIGIEAPMQ